MLITYCLACGFYDTAYDGMVSTQVEVNDIIVLCNVFGLLIWKKHKFSKLYGFY